MSISGIGVSWTESDDRRLCAECGCFYLYRCPCWERIGRPVVPVAPQPAADPDPGGILATFWQDSASRRAFTRARLQLKQYMEDRGMKTSEMFGSSFLKASDLGKSRVGVVIEDVTQEHLGDDDKWALSFRGKDKKLVLNRTNASIIEEVLGSDDTDEWVGKRIVLYATKVEFQGKRVDAIRVSDNPADYPKPKPTPVKDAPEPGSDVADEDLPF